MRAIGGVLRLLFACIFLTPWLTVQGNEEKNSERSESKESSLEWAGVGERTALPLTESWLQSDFLHPAKPRHHFPVKWNIAAVLIEESDDASAAVPVSAFWSSGAAYTDWLQSPETINGTLRPAWLDLAPFAPLALSGLAARPVRAMPAARYDTFAPGVIGATSSGLDWFHRDAVVYPTQPNLATILAESTAALIPLGDGSLTLAPANPLNLSDAKFTGPEVPVAPAAYTWPLSWAIDTGIYTIVPIGPKVYTSGTTNLAGLGVGKAAAFTAGGLSLSGASTRLNLSNYDVYFFTANPEDGSAINLFGSVYSATNQITVSGGAQGTFSSLGDHTGWLQFTPSLDWLKNTTPLPPSDYVLKINGTGSALTFSNSLQIDMWYYGWLVTNGGALSITGVPDSLRNPSVPSINGMLGGGTILTGYVNAPGYNNAGIVADGTNSRITLNETGNTQLGTGVWAANGGAITFNGTGGQGGSYSLNVQSPLTLSGTGSSITIQNYVNVTFETGAVSSLAVPTGTLSITGLGDGSTFYPWYSPTYAATSSGANLSITNFQYFNADSGAQITATGGGKITLSGSNTANSQLSLQGTPVTVTGTSAANLSTLTLSKFGLENIQSNLTAGAYSRLYLTDGFAGITLGTPFAPINLTASGANADLRVNNDGTTTGTLTYLYLYGNATASQGGTLYLDGSANGLIAASFSDNPLAPGTQGNLSATGTNSILSFRYFASPTFTSGQTLTATGGGTLNLTGNKLNTGNTLTFNPQLVMDGGSTLNAKDYHVVNAGTDDAAALTIAAGMLNINSSGLSGSTFTAAGNTATASLGATGSSATINLGTTTAFANVNLTGAQALTATGGGTVNVIGAATSTLTVDSTAGIPAVIGVGSSTPSTLTFDKFTTESIGTNLTAGTYGHIYVLGTNAALTLGSSTAPVTETATGLGSILGINNNGSTTGTLASLTFYGSATATQGGTLNLFGTAAGGTAVFGSYSLGATGSNTSVLAFRYFNNPSFAHDQTLTATGGGTLNLTGNKLNTNNTLTFNPTLVLDGSGTLNVADYHVVNAGTDDAATLNVAAGTVNFNSSGLSGSTFTAAGNTASASLGATGSGATVNIGTTTGFTNVNLTGANALTATGGGKVNVIGAATSTLTASSSSGIPAVTGVDANTPSILTFDKFTTESIGASLTAGTYGRIYVLGTNAALTLGSSSAPVTETATGLGSILGINNNGSTTGTLASLSFYGSATATQGGTLNLFGTAAGGTTVSGSYSLGATGSNTSVLAFRYFNNPSFVHDQTLTATGGGALYLYGNKLNTNNTLTFSPTLVLDGSSTINVADYHVINAGADAASTLNIAAGTVNLNSSGLPGSSFTAAGSTSTSALGATGSGATVNIGTTTPFASVSLTGSQALTATGGGTVNVIGAATSTLTVSSTAGIPAVTGVDASTPSTLTFDKFTTETIGASLTAGSYGHVYVLGTNAALTLGSSTAPVTETATGLGSILGINNNGSTTGTLASLAFYGTATATQGGTLNLFGTVASGTTVSGTYSLGATNGPTSVLSFRYFNNPSFTSTQTLTATGGGTLNLTGNKLADALKNTLTFSPTLVMDAGSTLNVSDYHVVNAGATATATLNFAAGTLNIDSSGLTGSSFIAAGSTSTSALGATGSGAMVNIGTGTGTGFTTVTISGSNALTATGGGSVNVYGSGSGATLGLSGTVSNVSGSAGTPSNLVFNNFGTENLTGTLTAGSYGQIFVLGNSTALTLGPSSVLKANGLGAFLGLNNSGGATGATGTLTNLTFGGMLSALAGGTLFLDGSTAGTTTVTASPTASLTATGTGSSLYYRYFRGQNFNTSQTLTATAGGTLNLVGTKLADAVNNALIFNPLLTLDATGILNVTDYHSITAGATATSRLNFAAGTLNFNSSGQGGSSFTAAGTTASSSLGATGSNATVNIGTGTGTGFTTVTISGSNALTATGGGTVNVSGTGTGATLSLSGTVSNVSGSAGTPSNVIFNNFGTESLTGTLTAGTSGQIYVLGNSSALTLGAASAITATGAGAFVGLNYNGSATGTLTNLTLGGSLTASSGGKLYLDGSTAGTTTVSLNPTANLTATGAGSALFYRYFAGQNFNSNETLTATTSGTLNLFGTTFTDANNTLIFNPKLSLDATGILNVTDYHSITAGSTAAAQLNFAAGTLNLNGTGLSGSVFNAAGSSATAALGATGSSAKLNIGTTTGFETFNAPGAFALVATGGGTVKVNGTGGTDSVLNLTGTVPNVTGSSALVTSAMTFTNFATENITGSVKASTYGHLYFLGGTKVLNLGTSLAPVTAQATGPGAFLGFNNDGTSTVGTMGRLNFYGNATASAGGVIWLDGSPDGTTPTNFSGNFTATGAGSVINYRYFADQKFDWTQTLDADTGGVINLWGTKLPVLANTLTFNPTLKLAVTGSVGTLNASDYQTVLAGSDTRAVLNFAAGTLNINGSGLANSLFTAAGNSASAGLGATGSTAFVNLGTTTGFETFNATGSTPLTATNGGTVKVNGTATGNSVLNLTGSSPVVGGTGVATISLMTFGNFATENIPGNVTAGSYGHLYFSGGPQTINALNLGTSSVPVTLTATGTSADLRFNNNGTGTGISSAGTGTLGALTFYGNAVAALGGVLYLDGSLDGSSTTNFTGNLTATGTNSALYYRYFGNQSFAPTQTLTATTSGTVNLFGTKLASATDTLTFDPILVLSASGATGTINVTDYHTIMAGDLGAAVLNFAAGTLNIDGSGLATSVFTAAGSTSTAALGATGSAAKVNIGTTTGFETFNATGTTPLTAINGGTVKIMGTGTAASVLNLTGASPVVGGNGNTTISTMTFGNFATENVPGNVTAGSYGHFYFSGAGQTITNLNLGLQNAPVTLTATGTSADLRFNNSGTGLAGSNTGTGTLGALNFYGNAFALLGGSLYLDGSLNGTTTTTFTGNLTATSANSVIYYRNFADQRFTPTQTLTANTGGVLNFVGASGNLNNDTLVLNPTLALGSGSTINFNSYQTATVGSDSAAKLLVSAGTLNLNSTGSTSSTLTLAGAATLGSAVSGAVVQSGVSGTGYETVILQGTNTPASPTLEAIAGGTVTVAGSNSAASTVQIGNGGTLISGGTGSTSISNIYFYSFNNAAVYHDITAGSYSNIVFNGTPGGLTIGASGTPVNLTATGTSSSLRFNEWWWPGAGAWQTATTGDLTFYGNATATGGGLIYLDGTIAGTNATTFFGNLSATGSGSGIYYRYYANPTFATTQTLTATGGGYLQVYGGNDSSKANLSLNAQLVLGSGSEIDFLNYNNATVGSTAGASLLVSAGTLKFTGRGAGSAFNFPGGVSLGATASGANLTIGTGGSSGFESFTATGANPVVVTGGGTMLVSASGTPNATLTIADDASFTVGVAANGSKNVSTLVLSGFNHGTIYHDLTANYYSNFSIEGTPGGLTIGTSTAPVNLMSNGASSSLRFNEWYWPGAGAWQTATTGDLTFYGNATASAGGQLYLDGTPAGTNSTTFHGNISATGSGSGLYYRYYASPTFDSTQTLTATGGGYLQAYGGNDSSKAVLMLDAKLFLGSGSEIDFLNYNTATVGTTAGAGLLVSAGTLKFTGRGAGSTFNFPGATSLGATASGAVLNIGAPYVYMNGTSSSNFESFSITGSNPLVATGGGVVQISGSGTLNSTLTLASDANVTVGGGSGNSSNVSWLFLNGYTQAAIYHDLTVNSYGNLGIGGTPAGLTLGTSTAPITLTSNGAGSSLRINEWWQPNWQSWQLGTTGNLTFYGSAVASNGGTMAILGSQAGTNTTTFTGNLTATGSGSGLYYQYYAAPSFNPSQTLTATSGGYIQLLGGNDSTKANLTLDAKLVLGSGSEIDFLNYTTATVGTSAGAGLLISGGTLKFTGRGAGSVFNLPGGAALGANASGAYLDIGVPFVYMNGTGSNFESFTLTGSNPLVATGGGQVQIGGTGTTNSTLTIASDANVTVGVGSSGPTANSWLFLNGYNKAAIYHDLTANYYSTLAIGGTPGGLTLGTNTAPITLTSNGAGSSLRINEWWQPNWQSWQLGTTGNLTFYGNAVASNGGTLAILGSQAGTNTTTFTGNLTATGSGSSLYYQYYAAPSFNSSQTLTATGGGYIQLLGGNDSTKAKLSLDANLVLGSGSEIDFLNYTTVTVGSNAASDLLITGGILKFTGLGGTSIFMSAGTNALGATAKGATLTIGTGGSGGFANFDSTNIGSLVASAGGTFQVYGSGTGKLSIASGTAVSSVGTDSSTVSNLSFNGFNAEEVYHDVTAGAYSNLVFYGSSGGVTIGSALLPVNLMASGTSANLRFNNYFNAGIPGWQTGTTGSLTFYGNATASNGGTVYLDGTPAGTNTTSFLGNLSASGSGSQLFYRYYIGPVFASTQQVSALAGGTVYLTPGTSAASKVITFSPGSGTVLNANGSGSTINLQNYDLVTIGAVASAANSGAVNFQTIGNSSFAITTAGNASGNVNVTGRAAVGSYPTLSLANVQATGSNLNFSGFGPYTLGASVAANGGGLNFTGYTTSLTSGIPAVTVQVQQSPLTGSFSSLNGGWGTAYDTPFNNVNLTVDATSAYSLKNLDLTGGSLVINGTLNILPSADSNAPNQVRFNQAAFPLSGTGTINVNSGATLTTVTTTGASPMYWSLPATMTLTGQGTVRQLAPLNATSNVTPNAGTILSDTTGTLTVVATTLPAVNILSNTGTIRFQGNAGGTTGGLINFSGFGTIDNPGTIETISTYLTNAASLLPSSLAILSTTTMGNVQANGVNVKLDLTGASATLSNQSVNALNGSTVVLDGRDMTNVLLTSTPTGGTPGLLRGSTLAVSGTIGAASQNVSNLTTLSNATLTGATSVLQLYTNERIALDYTTPLAVTNGATLQLTGLGGQQVLSSSGTNLARIVVDNGATLMGAGGASNYVGLTVGATGKLNVGNANLANTRANQTLTVLGDLQLAASSTTTISIFGAANNSSSLFVSGSAGTAASSLGGTLSVNVASGLILTPGITYVVLQENGAGWNSASNRFGNAPAIGSQITSADGNWLFGVNYTGNQVILSTLATAVPEPSTYAALAGLAALGLAAWRRRHRPQG